MTTLDSSIWQSLSKQSWIFCAFRGWLPPGFPMLIKNWLGQIGLHTCCWSLHTQKLKIISVHDNLFLLSWKWFSSRQFSVCPNPLILQETSVCYTELMGLYIHAPSGYPPPGVDIIFLDVHARAWISTPRLGCPRPRMRVDVHASACTLMSTLACGHWKKI